MSSNVCCGLVLGQSELIYSGAGHKADLWAAHTKARKGT